MASAASGVAKKLQLKTVTQLSLTLCCLTGRLAQLQRTPALALASLLLDLGLGWLVSSHLLACLGLDQANITDIVFGGMEMVIRNLKSLIVWMMENPAGLKLNSVLSQALGNFFLYHIHLWMTYVMLMVPLLVPYLDTVLHLLSFSGLSVQISLVSDLFLLLTIHIHCFYAYARRLFISQTSGLTSLWRLFRQALFFDVHSLFISPKKRSLRTFWGGLFEILRLRDPPLKKLRVPFSSNKKWHLLFATVAKSVHSL